MRHLLVCLLLLLAGCSEAPEPVQDDLPDAEVSATTGAISGVVVNDAIVPLAGASVTIGSLGLETTAADDGTFVFEGLEPGVVFITAVAQDHQTAQASATIVAGEVAKVRMQLVFDPAPVPQIVTDKYNAHMALSDFYAVYILTELIGENELCKCTFTTAKVDDLKTVILEATWESSVMRVLGHELYWDVYSENSDWHSGWSESPTLRHHAGTGFPSDDEQLTVLVSSDVQPDVQQDVEIFLTQFSVVEAPSEWSLIEGS